MQDDVEAQCHLLRLWSLSVNSGICILCCSTAEECLSDHH